MSMQYFTTHFCPINAVEPGICVFCKTVLTELADPEKRSIHDRVSRKIRCLSNVLFISLALTGTDTGQAVCVMMVVMVLMTV
jgi:hypothetical protein